MSYDFKLFKRCAGEHPQVTAQRDAVELCATPLDPQKESLKRRVADALMAHNPQLKVFQFGYEEIARFEKISIDEARLKYRHLELNGPEGGSGIQIMLFDDEASLTVPFWHEEPLGIFRETARCLEIISREAGYLVFDPQIERVVDPSAGLDDSIASYSAVMDRIQEKFPTGKTKPRPWWKFW